MKCPNCNSQDLKVTDSRSSNDEVRRRRQCLSCGLRFTTLERIQTSNLLIVKKEGYREEFNREKLAKGISKACEKRPLPAGAIDKLIDEIEAEIYRMGKSEVASFEVGEMVMKRLRNLDHIAYIRFASVYRDFADIGSLKEEVDTLIQGKGEGSYLPGQLFLIPDDGIKVNVKKRGGKGRIKKSRKVRRSYV